jgi:hypothetical protein
MLYSSKELKPTIEIVEQIGGVCPSCGRKIEAGSSVVKVKPLNDSKGGKV